MTTRPTSQNPFQRLPIVAAGATIVLSVVALLTAFSNPAQTRFAWIGVFVAVSLLSLAVAWLVRGRQKWLTALVWLVYGLSACTFCLWLGAWVFDPSAPPPTKAASANEVLHFDFAKSAEGWQDLVRWDDKFLNPQPIKNAAILHSHQLDRGLAYEMPLTAGKWQDYTVEYKQPVQADVVTMDFYLPNTPDIAANWVGIAAVDGGPWLAGSGASVPLGQWTRLVLDLRGKYGADDRPINERPLHVQAVYMLQGGPKLTSGKITVGLDNVLVHQSTGLESIREQRGAGRTLLDFEDEDASRWGLSKSRVPTDTLTLSIDHSYRGQQALQWNTRLASGEQTYLMTTLPGPRKSGVWLAHLYLAGPDTPGAQPWASFYSFDKSANWKDSPTVSLQPGKWALLVWDTRAIEWDTTKDLVVGIQVGAADTPYVGTLYLDDVEVYEQ